MFRIRRPKKRKGFSLRQLPMIPTAMVGACVCLGLALVVGLSGMGTKNQEAEPALPGGTGSETLVSSLEEDTGGAGAALLEESPSSALQVLETQSTAQQEEETELSAVEQSPEEAAATKLQSLRETFPEGGYWNHMGVEDWDEFTVTDTPCEHDLYWDTYCNTYTGGIQEVFPQYNPMEQCLGFAALLSDLVFGEDAPVAVFTDYTQLRVGDNIRLELTEHSMVVLTVDEEGITVVECNSDYEHCRISWDRFLSWDDLAGYSYEMECITRYGD